MGIAIWHFEIVVALVAVKVKVMVIVLLVGQRESLAKGLRAKRQSRDATPRRFICS